MRIRNLHDDERDEERRKDISMCMHVYVCICMYIYIYTVYIYVHICMYVCVCVCAYAYVCMCIRHVPSVINQGRHSATIWNKMSKDFVF